MIEREEGLEEVSDRLSDKERRAIFFDVGRALVGSPRPSDSLGFDEGQLAHVASKPYYEEVWRDLFEVYRELEGAVSERRIRDMFEDAKERPGVAVEIGEGKALVSGKIIALVGYHPTFQDALTGIASIGPNDMSVPVTIWPRGERVEVLRII